MKFKRFLLENDFDSNTLEELELLLKHHEEDLEEYKDSDISAYESTLLDIKAIKKAIAKKTKNSVAGNQDTASSDTMSSTGSEE